MKFKEVEALTIKDIIKNRDYNYIDIRVTPPENWEEKSVFVGCCKSENGKLISLDGDIYSENEVVIMSEEWENEELGIKRGLTIVIQGEWI